MVPAYLIYGISSLNVVKKCLPLVREWKDVPKEDTFLHSYAVADGDIQSMDEKTHHKFVNIAVLLDLCDWSYSRLVEKMRVLTVKNEYSTIYLNAIYYKMTKKQEKWPQEMMDYVFFQQLAYTSVASQMIKAKNVNFRPLISHPDLAFETDPAYFWEIVPLNSIILLAIDPLTAAILKDMNPKAVAPRPVASVTPGVAASVTPVVAISMVPAVAACVANVAAAPVAPVAAASVTPAAASVANVAATVAPVAAAPVAPVAASVANVAAAPVAPVAAAPVAPVAASVANVAATVANVAATVAPVAAPVTPVAAVPVAPVVAASVAPVAAAPVAPVVAASLASVPEATAAPAEPTNLNRQPKNKRKKGRGRK